MVAKALFEDFVLCIQIIPLPYIRYNENLSNNPIFFGCPCGVGFCGLPAFWLPLFFNAISFVFTYQFMYSICNQSFWCSFTWIEVLQFRCSIPLSPLDYLTQKKKSPVKTLATIGGALHFLLGFLFCVSSMQEEIKDLCSISPLDNLHNLPH